MRKIPESLWLWHQQYEKSLALFPAQFHQPFYALCLSQSVIAQRLLFLKTVQLLPKFQWLFANRLVLALRQCAQNQRNKEATRENGARLA